MSRPSRKAATAAKSNIKSLFDLADPSELPLGSSSSNFDVEDVAEEEEQDEDEEVEEDEEDVPSHVEDLPLERESVIRHSNHSSREDIDRIFRFVEGEDTQDNLLEDCGSEEEEEADIDLIDSRASSPSKTNRRCQVSEDGQIIYKPLKKLQSSLMPFLGQETRQDTPKSTFEIINRALQVFVCMKSRGISIPQHLIPLNASSAAQSFFDSLTPFGMRALQSIVSGQKDFMALLCQTKGHGAFRRGSTESGVRLRSNHPGCYLGYGLSDLGEVEWVYTGRSAFLKERLFAHILYSQESWIEPQYTRPFHYQLSKRSSSVEYMPVNEFSLYMAYNEIKDLIALSEAIWCMILCTYRFDEMYLSLRDIAGMPSFLPFFEGANATPCWEKSTNVQDWQRWRRQDLDLRMYLNHRRVLFLLNRRATQALSEKRNGNPYFRNHRIVYEDIISINDKIAEVSLAIKQRESDLLLQGQFLAKFVKKGLSYSIENLRDISIDGAAFEELSNGEQTSLYCFLKVEINEDTDADDRESDFFYYCNQWEYALLRGIKVIAFSSFGSALYNIKRPFTVAGGQATFHIGLQLLSTLDHARSGLIDRRKEDVRRIGRPQYAVSGTISNSELIFELINGIKVVGLSVGHKCRLFYKDEREDGTFSSATLLDTPDLALWDQLGLPRDRQSAKVFLRLRFDAQYPYLSEDGMTLSERIRFSHAGFEFQAVNQSWIPNKTPRKLQKVLRQKSFKKALSQARQIVSDAGGPIQETLQEPEAVQHIIFDRDGEPECFRIRNVTLRLFPTQQPRGLYPSCAIFVIHTVNGKRSNGRIKIPATILQQMFMHADPADQDIEMKIDAWKKTIDQVRIYVSLPKANIWYEVTQLAPLNSMSSQAIIGLQKKPAKVVPKILSISDQSIEVQDQSSISDRTAELPPFLIRSATCFKQKGKAWQTTLPKIGSGIGTGSKSLRIHPAIALKICPENEESFSIQYKIDAWNKDEGQERLYVRNTSGTDRKWYDNTIKLTDSNWKYIKDARHFLSTEKGKKEIKQYQEVNQRTPKKLIKDKGEGSSRSVLKDKDANVPEKSRMKRNERKMRESQDDDFYLYVGPISKKSRSK